MGDLRTQELLAEQVALLSGAAQLFENSTPTALVQPTLYRAPVAGDAMTKFSLPSRVYEARIICSAAFRYAFASTASLCTLPVTADTALILRAPVDLSTFHVSVATAGSGATIAAWIQPLVNVT
jgi:hypothetical protein